MREAELTRLAREAELRALKAQINPHFLFNTLNTVNSLARDDPEAARSVNARLASVFRYSLDGSESEFVTLGQELDFVRDCMEIEKARFGARLRFSIEVDESLLRLRVLPMILQPLVENAVKHGVAPRSAGGTVRVVAAAENGVLRCRVTDDGAGTGGRGLADLLASGVGLRNVRERLEQIYGDRSSFTIDGDLQRGFAVELSFPAEGIET